MTRIVNGVTCRTRKESLQHIIEQAEAKRIGPNIENGDREGGCVYVYESGNHCAVGSLFSEEQLAWIKERGGNSCNIEPLALFVIGVENVETVTGMKLSELIGIQDMHDSVMTENLGVDVARSCVINYCRSELAMLIADEENNTQKSV